MCIVSTITSSAIGAAVASSIAEAATTVGGWLASAGIGTGISASTAASIGSITTSTLAGGVVGAGMGAATSALGGGNIGKGALIGGLSGGALSGVGEAIQVSGGIPIPFTDSTIGGGGSDLFNKTVMNILPETESTSSLGAGGSSTAKTAAAIEMADESPNWNKELAAGVVGDPAAKARLSIGSASFPSATETATKGAGGGSTGATFPSAAETAAKGAGGGSMGATLEDLFSAQGLLRTGAAAALALSGFKQASLIEQDAEDSAKSSEMEARVHEMEAGAAAEEARLHRIRAENEDKIAGYEKESVLKQKRQAAGAARTAAAGSGVLLEGRAESSPAMYEQDLAGEAAYEIGKIDMNTRTKQLTHMMNASAAETNARIARQRATMARIRGVQAMQASNLKSTSALIGGLANGAMVAAPLFIK